MVRIILWFLTVVSLIALLILNLSVLGAALRYSLITLSGWTGEKVFAWSVFVLLTTLILVVPLILARRLGRASFLKKVSKPILSVVLISLTNLPLVPLFYAFHPAPVLVGSRVSWLAQTLIREKSLIGKALSWLFEKDTVTGRVYIDSKGAMLENQRLEPMTGNFQESGLAVIEVEGLFGYLDRSGQMVVPPTFKQAFPFADGHAFVCPSDQELFGIIDPTGEFTVEPRFQNGTTFEEGLAYVVDDQGQGFVDSKGNWVLKLDRKPERTPSVSDGLIHVVEQGSTTYYNIEGQEFLKVPALCGPFSKNRAMAQDRTSGLFGYIDRQGTWVIPALYKDARSFREGLAPVQTEPDRWNFIDPDGNIVIQDVVIDPQQPGFKEGRCAVQKDGLWGFMDSSGKVVVDYQFHKVRPFSEGLAQVYINDYYGFINLKAEMPIPAHFPGSLGPSHLWADFEQGVCAAPFFQSRLGSLLGNSGGPGLPDQGFQWTKGAKLELKDADSPQPLSTPTPAETPAVVATASPSETPSTPSPTPAPAETPAVVATASPSETPSTPSPTPAPDAVENLTLEIGLGSDSQKPETNPEFHTESKKVFAFITLSPDQSGDLKVVWSALDPGIDFALTDRSQTPGNTTETFFANPPQKGWQVGEYKVSVSLNETLIGQRTFRVKAALSADTKEQKP